MSTPDSTTKTCNVCKQSFPATDEYFPRVSAKRGRILDYRCKACKSEYEKRYYAEHREKIAKRHEEYYAQYGDEIRTRRMAQYYENHERDTAKWRDYYKRTSEYHKERAKEYRKNNPEKVRLRVRIRGERRRKNGGTYTKRDILKLMELQKHKCHWCLCSLDKTKWHIDHVIPLSRGGSNDLSNIRLACAKCNMSKGNKMPWEWIGRLV